MCVGPFILSRKGEMFGTTDTVPLDLYEVDIVSHTMSQRTKWHLTYLLIVVFRGTYWNYRTIAQRTCYETTGGIFCCKLWQGITRY